MPCNLLYQWKSCTTSRNSNCVCFSIPHIASELSHSYQNMLLPGANIVFFRGQYQLGETQHVSLRHKQTCSLLFTHASFITMVRDILHVSVPSTTSGKQIQVQAALSLCNCGAFIAVITSHFQDMTINQLKHSFLKIHSYAMLLFDS